MKISVWVQQLIRFTHACFCPFTDLPIVSIKIGYNIYV